MSRLYYSEQGHAVPILGEELTSCRWARKLLDLPSTLAPAFVYLLARPHVGSSLPLRVAINGVEIEPVRSQGLQGYAWYECTIGPSALKLGRNVLDFWTDAVAMDAWSLAMEGGHTHPASYRSDDGGIHWRNEKMGYLNMLAGEYVVRVRMAEGDDPAPPVFIWEDSRLGRLGQLRQTMPQAARQSGSLLERVRALSGWLSTSWQHIGASPAAMPTPWDVDTILAWGRARSGHDGRLPNVMCVHYGVAFVSCCQALNIPARCVVGTYEINSHAGHFVAEVWFEEYDKWGLVDPNLDAMFMRQGQPLSAVEVQALGSDVSRYVIWGEGSEFQRRHAPIDSFVRNNYLNGRWIRCRGIWPRADFLSRPDLAPPGHGMTAFCETNWVWEQSLLVQGLGMFPNFADPGYFEASPVSVR